MKRCKKILVSGENYVGDISGYEVFTVGHYFEEHPENLKQIDELFVDTIIKHATSVYKMMEEDAKAYGYTGPATSNADGHATRGFVDRFKYSLQWDDKQILIMDHIDS